jgi:preprotein translocase subunit SecE
MASTDDSDEKKTDAEDGEGEGSSSEAIVQASAEAEPAEGESGEGARAELAAPGEGDDAVEATAFGSDRYVHAAFFAAGILAAYLASKLLVAGWNNLAAWPTAVRAVPQLVSYSEEQRDSFTLVAGAVVGTLTIVQSYRKESVRTWANEVAAELSKVTWPTREAVLNGTVVVVVASALATVYVAVLDKIWGFLTTLVYGA